MRGERVLAVQLSEEVVGKGTGSRTYALLKTFEILCPSVYKAKFGRFVAY